MSNLIQPKPYMDNLPYRRKAQYIEKRRNTSKIILDAGTPLPKSVSYEDIDLAFYNWVDKDLDIAYDGKRLPTYKLFSNQRISEYSQTWSNQDENGNLILNFKTITRENNPKKGQLYGGMAAIPGDRKYSMFVVPVQQENGTEAYDLYTMHLPTMVDFKYSVTMVTNKYELLNRMNELMQFQFKAIDCYLYPNGHPMPMILDDVSDQSEYSIDDRKYYSQTYAITLKGYIILDTDFEVTRMPSRIAIRDYKVMECKPKGKHKHGKKFTLDTVKNRYDEALGGQLINPSDKTKKTTTSSNLETLSVVDDCIKRPTEKFIDANSVNFVEEYVDAMRCIPDEQNHLFNKILKLLLHFTDCDQEIVFQIDTDMVITTFEISNVYDFKILVNGELLDLEENNSIKNGDEITVRISKDDDFAMSDMTIIGYDPNVIFDDRDNPESRLDENVIEEDITIETNKENNDEED